MKKAIIAALFALPLIIGSSQLALAEFAAGLKAYERHDFSGALRLLKEDGGADSSYLLGVMYFKGEGVKTDKTEAIRYLRHAGDLGNVRAQYNLGMIYDKGDGVTQDQKEASRWYRKAAVQGNSPSQFNLGLMLTNGEGVEQDRTEAVKWLRKAAKQGHVNARKLLKVMGEK